MNTMRNRTKGSLTVEAALIIPLFLSGMLAITMLINVIYVHQAVLMSLQNTCRKMVSVAYAIREMEGYGKDKIEDERVLDLISEGGELLTVGTATAMVTQELSEDKYVRDILLKGGSLSLLNSKFSLEDRIVDLVAEYEIALPFGTLFGRKLSFLQRVRMNAWLGYNDGVGGEDSEKDTVYITEAGVVYHESSDCSYIRPRVNSASVSVTSELRNKSGEKYYPCEFCGGTGAIIYYTAYGNRYHSSSTCSGIYHEVTAISRKEAEAQGRRSCSKCGK